MDPDGGNEVITTPLPTHKRDGLLLREDINPPRFLLNRVPEQITETNV